MASTLIKLSQCTKKSKTRNSKSVGKLFQEITYTSSQGQKIRIKVQKQAEFSSQHLKMIYNKDD